MDQEGYRDVRFPQERHRRVADLILDRGHVSVAELIDIFGVSGPTIRRDLAFLMRAGIVVRTHGGVTTANRSGGHEPLYMEKVRRQQTAKSCIASAAANHVGDGMRIVLDSGTTCLALARLLAGRPLSIVALDIKISEAAATGQTEVVAIGGRLRNGYFSVVGNQAVSAIATQEEADIFFLSADAVDRNGVSNVTAEEVGVKQAAMARARKTILVTDHTKLDRREGADVCSWSAIDRFITDRHPAAAPYEDVVTRLEYCNPEAGKQGTKTT